jgi:ribosomal protein L19
MWSAENNSYFSEDLLADANVTAEFSKKGEFIAGRRQRFPIKGFASKFKKGLFFQGGDIVRINFMRGGLGYYFEGLCLAVRKRKLLNKQASLVLRNTIYGVGIEMTVSYYFNRLYSLVFSDYKRKRFNYPRHKLYYLRAPNARAM